MHLVDEGDNAMPQKRRALSIKSGPGGTHPGVARYATEEARIVHKERTRKHIQGVAQEARIAHKEQTRKHIQHTHARCGCATEEARIAQKGQTRKHFQG